MQSEKEAKDDKKHPPSRTKSRQLKEPAEVVAEDVEPAEPEKFWPVSNDDNAHTRPLCHKLIQFTYCVYSSWIQVIA